MNQHNTLNVCLRIKSNEEFNEDNYKIRNEKTLEVKSSRGLEDYLFTKIFNTHCTQEDVFDYTSGRSIPEFLQGKDCLLIAHGTTNAGKTYSVSGNNQNPGIIPRTLREIFGAISQHIDQNPNLSPCNYNTTQIRNLRDKLTTTENRANILQWSNRAAAVIPVPQLANCSMSFCPELNSTLLAPSGTEQNGTVPNWGKTTRCSLWISILEIYNDALFDLLVENKYSTKLTISQDQKGRFYPGELVEVNVNTIEEAMTVIQYGQKHRQMSSTNLNNTSSRSHCILRLRLVRVDRSSKSIMNIGPHSPAACDVEDSQVSTFLICDLAGAERTNKIGSAVGRQKETANINSDLVVLGRCITALHLKGSTNVSQFTPVVPFRESKLTKVLQPILPVAGPKHLIVNISTNSNLIDETINVLKFSSIARKVLVKDSGVSSHTFHLLHSKPSSCASNDSRISNEDTRKQTNEDTTQELMDNKFTQTEYFDIDKLYNTIKELEEEKKTVIYFYESLEKEKKVDHKKALEDKELQMEEIMEKRLALRQDYYENKLQKLEEQLKKENDDAKVVNEVLEKDNRELNHKLDKINQINCDLNMKINQLESSVQSSIDECTELKSKCEKLSEIILNKDRELEDLKKEGASVDLIEKVNQLESNIKSCNDENNKLKIKYERLKHDNIEKDKEIDVLQKSIKKTANIEHELSEKINKLQKENDILKAENEKLEDEKSKEISTLEQSIKQTADTEVKLKEENDKLKSYIKKLQEAEDNLRAKYEKTKDDLSTAKNAVRYLCDEFNPKLRQSLSGCANEDYMWTQLERELKDVPNKYAILKSKNKELEKAVDVKDVEINKLKTNHQLIMERYEKINDELREKLTDAKRENSCLVQNMNNITPRKIDDTTPLKEFKTPLTPAAKNTSVCFVGEINVNNTIEEPPASSAKKSARGRRTRNTPASKTKKSQSVLFDEAENVEPESTTTEQPKATRRRKLIKNSLHPALDSPEVLDVPFPDFNPVANYRRQLRSKK